MTRNLFIATFFLLASTVLLGVIWLRENDVLEKRAALFGGAQLARGAADYEQYCATCHGLTGEGGVSSGAPQINNLPTTLKEQERLDGPNGITAKYGTVRNFVESTIASGIRGTAMPRWSQRFGGPLRDDQIKNIAAYLESLWAAEGTPVPNITDGAAQVAVAYRETVQAGLAAAAESDTPAGRGKVVFAQCAVCHTLTDKDSQTGAPGLGGLFGPEGTAAFGTVLPNTKPVNPQNFFEWVRKGGVAFRDGPQAQPNPGFGPYQITAMPPFPSLTDEQLADLLAYISMHDRQGEQTLPALGPDGQPLPEQAEGTAVPGGAPTTQPTPSGPVQPNTAPDSDTAAPTPTLGR